MDKEDYIFLDSYVLQKDMRIRLPKILEKNLNIKKGETVFNIYLKNDKSEIVLRVAEEDELE